MWWFKIISLQEIRRFYRKNSKVCKTKASKVRGKIFIGPEINLNEQTNTAFLYSTKWSRNENNEKFEIAYTLNELLILNYFVSQAKLWWLVSHVSLAILSLSPVQLKLQEFSGNEKLTLQHFFWHEMLSSWSLHWLEPPAKKVKLQNLKCTYKKSISEENNQPWDWWHYHALSHTYILETDY